MNQTSDLDPCTEFLSKGSLNTDEVNELFDGVAAEYISLYKNPLEKYAQYYVLTELKDALDAYQMASAFLCVLQNKNITMLDCKIRERQDGDGDYSISRFFMAVTNLSDPSGASQKETFRLDRGYSYPQLKNVLTYDQKKACDTMNSISRKFSIEDEISHFYNNCFELGNVAQKFRQHYPKAAPLIEKFYLEKSLKETIKSKEDLAISRASKL